MPAALYKLLSTLALVLLSLVGGSGVQAKAVAMEQLRADFLEAERLLQKGDRSSFRSMARQLQEQGYPLYPYLVFAELRKYMDSSTAQQLEDFSNTYADSPLAYRLQHSRLFSLARQRKWHDFLDAYRDSSNEKLQCHYLQALIATANTAKMRADSAIDAIWLRGHSLPTGCDPAIAFWQEQGLLTPARVWARIELAMQAGNPRLARHLTRYLPAPEVQWMDLWDKLHRKPQLILNQQILQGRHPVKTRIFVHAIKRLARQDPLLAIDIWKRHERDYDISQQQHAEINRVIGLKLAYRNHADALVWLTSVPQRYADQKVREWRIRSALNQGDWTETLFWIGQLPAAEGDTPQWQYWRARALEAQGADAAAHAIYRSLAQTRSFEGFLAADKLHIPYRYNHRELDIQADEIFRFAQEPGIVRARELRLLGRMLDARREWYHATRGLDDRALQVAAKLAHSWDWHDQAILTLGRSSYRDDLELRFPVVFREQVHTHSSSVQIDPAWAFAVIRQESAFARDARSHRDARGLMQLLPRTARAVAHSLNTRLRHTADLHKAEVNIELGVHYLKTVMSRFSDNMVLATAAYNAGSYRVHRWLPKTDGMAADVWIETIPFNETRNYLKRVLTYTAIYEHRLGATATPLSRRMQMIPPDGTPQPAITTSMDQAHKS